MARNVEGDVVVVPSGGITMSVTALNPQDGLLTILHPTTRSNIFSIQVIGYSMTRLSRWVCLDAETWDIFIHDDGGFVEGRFA